MQRNISQDLGGLFSHPNFGITFSNSFFPYMAKQWNNLDVCTQVMMPPDFRLQLKNDLNTFFQKAQNWAIHFLVE